jgi:hypothetical protein
VGSVVVSSGIDPVAMDPDSGLPYNDVIVVAVTARGAGSVTPMPGTYSFKKEKAHVFTFRAYETGVPNWIVDVKADGVSLGPITSFDTSIWDEGTRHTLDIEFTDYYPIP